MLHRIDQAEMTPVFAENIKADIRGAVLVGRIRFDERIDQVKILVQGVDLRISAPLKDLLLKEEAGAVHFIDDLLAIRKPIIGNDVHHIIE